MSQNHFLEENKEISQKEENKKLLKTLAGKFGLISDPAKIAVYYSDGKLHFSLRYPEFRYVTMWADAIDKLTAQAINFAIDHGKDPETCLYVKDFLGGVFNIGDNPPTERIFANFVDWGTKVDLRSISIDMEPGEKVLKISGNEYSYDILKRYIPRNFSIEELSGFLLTSGDLPKDKLVATNLFNERNRSKKNGPTKRKSDWRNRD